MNSYFGRRDAVLNKDHYLEGMVRFGLVTKVSTNNQVAATISYPDRHFQTPYLPCLQKNTVGTQEFYVPVVGELVAVLHLHGALEKGVILGSVYTTQNPPPYNVGTKRGIIFGDGSYVIYDTAGGGLYDINVKGKANITAVSDINVKSSANITIEAATNVTVKGTLITLDAPNVKVTGMLWVDNIKPYQSSQVLANPQVHNVDGSGGGS